MPGTAIGTKFPTRLPETVLQADITIRKEDGKYSVKWNYQPFADEAIVRRVQTFLDNTIKELNGEGQGKPNPG